MKGKLEIIPREDTTLKLGDFTTTGEKVIGVYGEVVELFNIEESKLYTKQKDEIFPADIKVKDFRVSKESQRNIRISQLDEEVEFTKHIHKISPFAGDEIMVLDINVINSFASKVKDSKIVIGNYNKKFNNYTCFIKVPAGERIKIYLRRNQFELVDNDSYTLAELK